MVTPVVLADRSIAVRVSVLDPLAAM